MNAPLPKLPPPSVLSVRDVWKTYANRPILERVSIELAAGSFLAVVGPTGCGKTTFLRMLMSEEFPTSGTIELDGRKLPDEPTADRGVVFQRYSVFPHLTVLGNAVLPLELAAAPRLGRLFGAARRRAEATAGAMLEHVGLGPAAALYPAQLSGGMQQRLALAQALIRQPRVLLLDEPFSALDPGTRADIHALTRRLWQETGMTVVMVTHDISEAFSLGTRVIVFERPIPDDAKRGARITHDIPVRRRTPRQPAALPLTASPHTACPPPTACPPIA